MPRKLKSWSKGIVAYVPALNLLWDIVKTLRAWLL
jgi:hypothetical protein